MTADDESLDRAVRETAPDLWLSSRLVGDAALRGTLIGLYAVYGELAKLAAAVKTPLAGEIRLAWWREEVDGLSAAGGAPGHPGLVRLRGAPTSVLAALDGIIEARHAELDARPFADEAGLTAYIDGVDGGLVRAASRLPGPNDAGPADPYRPCAGSEPAAQGPRGMAVARPGLDAGGLG